MDKQSDARLLKDYRRLIEIARDLASTLDLDPLLHRIINAGKDITGADAASILLYDSISRQLHFQVATNMDEPTMRGLIVPLEDSIAGWIVKHREPAFSNNVLQDKRYFANVSKETGYETRSLLGVPLITKDKVVGVLEVINKKAGEFNENDENLLTVLGAQAAVAIENTRLFQQSDLVSEFVHELRTPLAAISTATYLLLRPEISPEQSQQIATNVHNEALRLNTMTSSFLDLARLESGRIQFKTTLFDIGKLMEECASLLQTKADEMHVQIRVKPSKKLQVEADRDKMKQVLLNLLSNGIKYNKPEGTVTLSAQADGNETILTVADTGVGIPADALPYLFQKFYRVRDTEGKVSGTGLGLSICKQIVQGHGGTITVHSQVHKGSIFTIHLPKK
jgi:signal transduction histidine kinase